jgi:hypothetical protein
MSLVDEVNKLCGAGHLYQVPQSGFQLPQRRTIYGSGLIRTLLSGIGADQDQRLRVLELQADFDYFIDGHKVNLRSLRSVEESAFMALLEPPSYEVWEIRSIDPAPSIRVFGSFVQLNTFVALTWAWRNELGAKYSSEWRAAIQEFKEEWELYFGTIRPISGRYPDAYLTNFRIIR